MVDPKIKVIPVSILLLKTIIDKHTLIITNIYITNSCNPRFSSTMFYNQLEYPRQHQLFFNLFPGVIYCQYLGCKSYVFGKLWRLFLFNFASFWLGKELFQIPCLFSISSQKTILVCLY